MICPICENKDELAGFCMVCGAIAGSEADEHSMMIGVCYDCVLELKEEIGERDEYYGSGM